ncbi:hypothetical protein F6X54_27990 [Micromonospora aurantiaca]|uniref:DUF6881 domain-containing protein n=1 Tax=Micromonospora aurantiaca (nom. illeg.) TaxID=47850 RepID=A0ABQ6U914_9ACTN|nr:hypothetical protein [Micromonospora aurantiaca]KAB1105087.1 hypothetical protein F6X54_27990 [Micromonospora aurantiaca]
MRYVKVVWEHDFPDDPILYLSEIGEDGYEIRKVQLYRDGRTEWADGHHETATVGLSEIPFPPVEEISAQSGFRAELITPEEFEHAWSEARAKT